MVYIEEGKLGICLSATVKHVKPQKAILQLKATVVFVPKESRITLSMSWRNIYLGASRYGQQAEGIIF